MSLLDLVREFVALSDESEWGGDSLPKVKELMMELRRRDFSSFEVSELSGDRWSSSIIRVYTKGWGVVTDLSEKKRLFSDLRKLASSRHSLEDVEWFNRVDGSITRMGSTPEAVAELNTEMEKLGLAPGEAGEMLTVSRQLRDEPGGIVGVKDRIALDKELRDQGITHNVMLSLQKKCIEYGRLSHVLDGMDLYIDVQDINTEYHRLDKICKDNETKNLELEDSIRQSQQVIDALNEVYHFGWTPITLLEFPLWLRKSDTPESIRQALADSSGC
ncbi:MAG: hypothetical protein NTV15_01050 [Candidatus Bathyarchaeota archaeon]|nr:hypothetical protein [Candidatus Bathyarchaeota archaeon]